LVAAPPRCAVSQVFNLPLAACEQRSADYKSEIGSLAPAGSVLWTFAPLRRAKPFRRFPSGSSQQIKNLCYGKQINTHFDATCSDDTLRGMSFPGGKGELAALQQAWRSKRSAMDPHPFFALEDVTRRAWARSREVEDELEAMFQRM